MVDKYSPMSKIDAGQETIDEFARGTIYTFLGHAIVKLLSFVFTIFVLNYFSASESDLFFKVNSIFFALASIAGLGLSFAAIRFIPKYVMDREYAKVYGHIAFSLFVGWAVLMILLSIIYIGLDILKLGFGSDISESYPLIAISAFVFLLYEYLRGPLTGLKSFKTLAISEAGFQILRFCLLITIIYLGSSLASDLLGAQILSYVLVCILMVAVIYSKIKKKVRGFRFSFKEGVENITFGVPIFISSSIDVLLTHIDVLFIALFFSDVPGVVSGYSAIILIVRNIGPMVAMPFSSVQQPFLVEKSIGDEKEFLQMIKEVNRWIMYIGIPILVFFLVYIDPIMSIMAHDYVQYSRIIWLFIPLVLGTLISSSHRNALFARGEVFALFIASMSIIMINVLADWILIPKMAASGAAIGSTIAAVTGESAIIYYAYKKFGARLHKDIIKAIGAGIAALVLSYLIALDVLAAVGAIELILAATTTCVFYSTVIILFKGLKSRDFEIIIKFLKRYGVWRFLSFSRPMIELVVRYTG